MTETLDNWDLKLSTDLKLVEKTVIPHGFFTQIPFHKGLFEIFVQTTYDLLADTYLELYLRRSQNDYLLCTFSHVCKSAKLMLGGLEGVQTFYIRHAYRTPDIVRAWKDEMPLLTAFCASETDKRQVTLSGISVND